MEVSQSNNPFMALTQQQKNILKEKCNVMPLSDVVKYIMQGDISLSELTKLTPERRASIEEKLANQPNPEEQKDWQKVEASKCELGGPLEMLQQYLMGLHGYISRWEQTKSAKNHVAEAKSIAAAIDDEMRKRVIVEEEKDWENIDLFSAVSIEAFLTKYPVSKYRKDAEGALWGLTDTNYIPSMEEFLMKYPQSQFRSEAEKAIWNLVDKEDVVAVQDFINKHPASSSVADAKKVLDSIVEWEKIKGASDIFTTISYVKHKPDSPFRKQAELLILMLKKQEMEDMKSNKNSYEVQRLLRLLDENIIGLPELIKENIITEEIVERLRNTDLTYDLPDIRKALENSVPECPEGYTDVFFFGIPGTGKTCVLMGLACSNELNINLASSGGDYAEALQAYTDLGKTPPANPGDYVTTIPATVNATDGDAIHKLNLVEMSGEEFAFEIAKAEKKKADGSSSKVFTFEEMGSGATKLLQQQNRKVFFMIIDPTVDYVVFKRKQLTGYDETTGVPVYDLNTCSVRQTAVIQRMINLFENKANSEIMRKVDSIHVIVTKADLLGEGSERESKAMDIIEHKYKNILNPLYRIGKEYNINVNTGYMPKLYTFSLGSFYVGGMYEYNNYDSNRLVKAIRNATSKARSRTWWDKFCDKIN